VPLGETGNTLLSQPRIKQRLEATVKQRHMSYTLHKMNNNINILAERGVVLFRKDARGSV